MDSILLTVISLAIAMSIGSLILLVRAFQESVWWGVASLVIPGAQTVFGALYWSRVKYSFVVSHTSAILILAILFRAGASVMALEELTPKIQERRSRIEVLETRFHALGTELSAQFAALNKQRAALKANDAAAVHQFNANAAAYDLKNKMHKAMAAEIEFTQRELQELLDERSTVRDGKKRN